MRRPLWGFRQWTRRCAVLIAAVCILATLTCVASIGRTWMVERTFGDQNYWATGFEDGQFVLWSPLGYLFRPQLVFLEGQDTFFRRGPLGKRRWELLIQNNGSFVALPAWFFAGFALPALYMARVLRRTVESGTCRKCGYDLRGGVGPVCPECGLSRTSVDDRAIAR